MQLDESSKTLLTEIFKFGLTHSEGVNATRFRAKHHEELDLLDAMESARYIGKRNGNYHLMLSALMELCGSVPEVENLFDICEKLFQALRQFYLEHTDEPLDLAELSKMTGLPNQELNLGLAYMVEISLFNGYLTTPNTFEYISVTPGERFLRHNNFTGAVNDILSWRSHSEDRIPAHKTNINQEVDSIGDFQSLLHPEIIKHALPQYNNGHLREAVLNSIIAVFDLIREKTGLKDDGERLISTAYSLDDPYLVLSDIDTESGRNDQKGFIQVYKGSFQGIRNPKAHSLVNDLPNSKLRST